MNVNIADVINRTSERVETVLTERKKEEYFDTIVLLYSFIENMLKWLIFVKILWEKHKRTKLVGEKEVNSIERFCKDLRFYNSIRVALVIDLIDFKLCQRIDKIRNLRNDNIHQLWLYTHRDDIRQLRKELEGLARTANMLVIVSNKLVKDIGCEGIWTVSLERPRK